MTKSRSWKSVAALGTAVFLLLGAGAAVASWKAVGSSIGQRVVVGAVHADLSFTSGASKVAQYGTSVITVRNADLVAPITLNSLKFYNSAGVLVKSLLASPVVIPKMGSARFEINKTTVGVNPYPKAQSASTVHLEWQSATAVRPPVIASVLYIYYPTGTGVQFNAATDQAIAVIMERQLP